ncbi:calcium-binding protein [Leptothoe spongobia]|uniref:Calcium-binding protein n=1 Tax=Leptothoe spongobia TAU-MAC 1115 TaxID=1967444 RepID=A0A947DEY0_9CYAN|nr:calcium-binding protein [Leptothoe spongobia]MBT9315773.1 hypothetical protein [Leptothoe spongobia TAU-MAC 1115]
MFPFTNFINDDWIDGDLFDTDIVTPITGTSGNDLILSDAGLNEMQGLEGDDLLIGGPGTNTFIGGEGNDVLNGLSGYSILEESGDYSFTLSDSQLIADDGSGTVYTDLLFGMDEADLHATGTGDHTIDATAFSGTTIINVDDGNNTILGSQQRDNILGGIGNDTVEGNGGDDAITGFDGNDLLKGNAGADSINGGDGDDTLRGGAGKDTLSGGNDNDSIFGGGKDDAILGGLGDDTLSGGIGEDFIDGEFGTDTLSESGDFDFVLTDTSLTTTDSAGNVEVDTLVDIEDAILEGGIGSNTIDASGFSGTTTLQGKAGADTLIGGIGNDVIVGGALVDTLTSGSLADQDIFLYNMSSHGGDVITDFDTFGLFFGNEDMIHVQASGFAPTGGAAALSIGVLASNLLVDMAGNLGASSGFRYNAATGALFYDSDGGTGATGTSLLAALSNTPTLAALDGNIQVV